MFFLLIFSILGLSYFYLGVHVATAKGAWLLLLIPFTLVASVPLLFSHPRNLEPSRFRMGWLHATYLAMGFLSFLLALAVLQDLIGFGVSLWRHGQAGPELPIISPIHMVELALATLLFGIFRAARGPFNREIDVAYPELPQALEGLRIVHISDLHIGQTIKKKYVQRVMESAAGLRPDLIALTGDIGDAPLSQMKSVSALLSQLPRLAPTYFVPGNHEYYWDAPAWIAEMERAGMRVLLNRGETLAAKGESVFVGGITDPAAAAFHSTAVPDVKAAAQGSTGAAFRLFLSHRPGFAKEAETHGFQLQLSGHTHGGQFFPWTLVARLVHEFNLGLYKTGRLFIYVSGGTGTWGPLIRVGTTPEITLIRVVR